MSVANWNNELHPGMGVPHANAYLSADTSVVRNGALAMWDSGIVKELDALASWHTKGIGVMTDANPVASNLLPSGSKTLAMVARDGIFSFHTTAGDGSLTHGTALYMGADAQTVTTAIGAGAASDAVGTVWLPDHAAVTAAAGTDILVKLSVYVTNL